MYGSFHRWYLVAIYVVAVALLGYHLQHGLWSGAQTAGSDNPVATTTPPSSPSIA